MAGARRGRGRVVPLAKDEGHGFTKKSNEDAYLGVVASFLEKLAKTP